MIMVTKLVEILKEHNPTDVVIMSIDPEGNGYAALECISKDNYLDGEIGIRELTPELEKAGYEQDDVLVGISCITLWPGYE